SNPNQKLLIGYDTTNNFGFMGAVLSGAAWMPIALNPNGGNVGIGTANPAQKLEVNGQVQVDTLASATSTAVCITAVPNGVLATCSSSIRYKERVRSAAFGLAEVMAMRPVTF